MRRLIPLDAPEARETAFVGAKAARLSRAIAAGLPVLGGWVLPVPASSIAMELGRDALERRSRAMAIRVVSSTAIDEGLTRDLADVEHPAARTSIVRSSTSFDGDGRWAGAFATYHDVEPGLLPVAVRGCWASAFSADVLGRARALRLGVADAGVGVVIQPWLSFAFGGTARSDPDDAVVLTVAEGGPVGIVAGAGGTTIRVDPGSDGDRSDVVAAAVALSRATAAATGDDRIEWGWAGGEIHLLQASRQQGAPVVRAADRIPALSASPRLRAFATTVARCRAPLGDRLVVPWALAIDEMPEAATVRVGDTARALAEATALADRLAGDAWGVSPDAALRAASDVARGLLGPEPERGIASMPALRRSDRSAAARLLGLVAGMGRTLQAAGVLDGADEIWRLTEDELRRAIDHGDGGPVRSGPDRWEPLVFQVAMADRPPRSGVSAAPGIGAGPVHAVADTPSTLPPSRAVVVARAPHPQLAPLLFRASAVVTAGGSTGAHLFEVARSLGIPAVVGVDLSVVPEDAVLAVDGDRAEVGILETTREPVTVGERS